MLYLLYVRRGSRDINLILLLIKQLRHAVACVRYVKHGVRLGQPSGSFIRFNVYVYKVAIRSSFLMRVVG
jgi:hypothetical protein